MSPPGVARVSSSSSPVIAPTSMVITPPVVELNEDQLVSATLPSVRLARRQHLVKCRLLVRVYAEIPVRLYPDPPACILAPVGVVRRFPRFRPLVPLSSVRPCVGAQEHLRVVSISLAVCGTPRSRTSPGVPGVRERNHMVYVDLGRIGHRLPRIRIEPRPVRYGAVLVYLDALAVPDQRGVPHVTGAVGLPPTEARRIRGPVRELLSRVSRHASRCGDRKPP